MIYPPPLLLLGGVVAGGAAMCAIEMLRARRRAAVFRRLARRASRHYSREDQLGLTARVAPLLPTPGAAAVSVSDVVYSTLDGRHQYVFTAEYTVGALRSKRRVRRVAMLSEPHARFTQTETSITFADPASTPLEQYQSLLVKVSTPGGPPPEASAAE